MGFLFGREDLIKSEQPCAVIINDFVFECPTLMGNFNCYNILAAVRMALALGIESQAIASSLQLFSGVPGRLEQFNMPNGARCIIDYAHNPSSYQAVLSMLRAQTDDLIVIFGAGGKRDPHKRPIMGGIAASFADTIILTSDNPRTEDPFAIMDAIAAGVKDKNKVVYEVDRAKAIEIAYKKSRTGSIIVILGKGTDEYQIIGSEKKKFSEKQIIQALY
jgi:UDP-N-acetylmuramyl-tripeptide synthetase